MASDDPLAQYRRPGHTAPKPQQQGGQALSEYKAFGEAAAPTRVWLKRSGADEGPAYGYLMNVTTDTWGIISLNFSIPMVVIIHGECMEPLAEAFMKGTVAWVQEYDPKRFIDPPLGQPIIREIEVHRTRPEEPTHH
jgi:hypothetical protein